MKLRLDDPQMSLPEFNLDLTMLLHHHSRMY